MMNRRRLNPMSADELPVATDKPKGLTRCFLVLAVASTSSLRFYSIQSQSYPWLQHIKPALAVVNVAALLFIVWLAVADRSWMRRIGSSPSASILLLMLAALSLSLLHPFFDGLDDKSVASGLGGDRDDALIDGARRMVSFKDPYLTPVFSGYPISPGPGWLLLNAFVAIPRLFPLMVPIHALLLSLLCYSVTGSLAPGFWALLLCLGSAGFWENSYGSDLSALALALASCSVASLSMGRHRGALTGIAMTAGALSTARLPLLAYPCLLAVLHASRKEFKNAVLIAVVGTATALLLHGVFIVGFSRPYPPFHLAAVGISLLGVMGIAAVAGSIVFLTWYALQKGIRTVAEGLWFQGVILLIAFGSVSVGALEHQGWQFGGPRDWTAYLVISLPSLAASCCLMPYRQKL